MRAIVQRVLKSSVSIGDSEYSSINRGLLVLIGICEEDESEDTEWLVQKITNMRIFSDEQGKMNLSLIQISGEILIVSQFTLHASTKKGNRPSFIASAKPEKAIPLYNAFIEKCQSITGIGVKTGQFGTDMKISLINDGPVTIILDSKNKE
ncbi:MAG: D-aminoacyl-tRNA deacylase [Bacteroidia bacterium]